MRKQYLVFTLIFIFCLCMMLLFRCKSRSERMREYWEKRETAKIRSEIRAIESDKQPVYSIQGKNGTLESNSLIIRLLNVRIGNCVLPEVNVRMIPTQEFPYLMGMKAWNMLLSSLPSDEAQK